MEISNNIGYPVAMRLTSDGMLHKTEVGGVILGIENDKDLKLGWKELTASAEKLVSEISGILVQKMLHGGQEVIIGFRQDEQFGPLVLFGSGGTDVELFKDVETGIAPLNENQADQLIKGNHVAKKLKGWRNQPPADYDTLLRFLVNIAQLADDLPQTSELEINPLTLCQWVREPMQWI